MKQKLQKGLEVIHHKTGDINWGNTDGLGKSLFQLKNTISTNSFEDDDLEYGDGHEAGYGDRSRLRSASNYNQKFLSVLNRGISGSNYIQPTKSTSRNSIRQHKVYLNNITTNVGDLVRLPCPYSHPEISSNTQPEQYFSTKTVSFFNFENG